jgi:hypothetical protein
MVSCGFPLQISQVAFLLQKKKRKGLTVIGDDFYSIVLPNANASFGSYERERLRDGRTYE